MAVTVIVCASQFAAIEAVGVVVMVAINTEGARRLGAEEAHVLGMLGDGFRDA